MDAPIRVGRARLNRGASTPILPWGSLLLLAAGLLLALTGCATRPKVVPLPTLQGDEVTTELKKSMAGWNVGNLDTFMAIYADNATFARPDGFVRGKAAIRALYAPMFEAGIARDSLAFERLEVDVISADAVLVKGIYANMRNGSVTRRGTTSLVLRLFNGQWRIVHDHSF